MKKIFILLATVYLSLSLNAQRGWEVGGSVGVSHYFGDLNTNFNVMHPGAAAGVGSRFNFNERICAKLGATYGRISADDKYSSNPYEIRRNINFKSNVFDLAAQLEFNFMPYNYFDHTKHFSPYLFAGFNVYNFNPTTTYNGKTYALRTLGTEGQFKGEEYYTTQMGLVYGGGFKIALNEVWSINVDISARKLFTDYLDDVSKAYPNFNDLKKLRGEVAVALSDPSVPDSEGKKFGQVGRQRGDRKDNDIYTFLTVGMYYYFGDLKCPTISNR